MLVQRESRRVMSSHPSRSWGSTMSSFAKAGAVALVASTLATAGGPRRPIAQSRPGRTQDSGESYEPILAFLWVDSGFSRAGGDRAVQHHLRHRARQRHDLITIVRLARSAVELNKLGWLNLFASAGSGSTALQPEDHMDFRVGFDGRLDIQRNWYLYGGCSSITSMRIAPIPTPRRPASWMNTTCSPPISASLREIQPLEPEARRSQYRRYHPHEQQERHLDTISNHDHDRTEYTESPRGLRVHRQPRSLRRAVPTSGFIAAVGR